MLILAKYWQYKHFNESTMNDTTYVESKLDGKSYCKSNGRFTKHLKAHGMSPKEYYETYISGYTPLCTCLKPTTFYKNETYAKSCGSPKCVGNSVSNTKQNLSKEQKAIASLNYRAGSAAKTVEQKAAERLKAKQTYFEKYGVAWASSIEQKTKSQNSKLEKYGSTTFNNSVASAEKNRNKLVSEQNKINQKRRSTNLAVHGVENTFLKPDVKSKSAKSNSTGVDYVSPSGEIVGVRGYEGIAITQLLKTHLESDFVFDNRKMKYDLPTFQYIDHRRHILKYYPDIYIPKENKIIEVKSRWWWDGFGAAKYKSRLSNNLKKRQAVLAKGYIYELWLFENKTTYKVLTNDTDF